MSMMTYQYPGGGGQNGIEDLINDGTFSFPKYRV